MRYKPLSPKAEIDAEMALLQAVSALDAAAETAEKVNDVEGLLNTAAMWMKMSGTIGHFAEAVAEAEKEEVVKTSPRIEMGFCAAEIIAEEDDEE